MPRLKVGKDDFAKFLEGLETHRFQGSTERRTIKKEETLRLDLENSTSSTAIEGYNFQVHICGNRSSSKGQPRGTIASLNIPKVLDYRQLDMARLREGFQRSAQGIWKDGQCETITHIHTGSPLDLIDILTMENIKACIEGKNKEVDLGWLGINGERAYLKGSRVNGNNKLLLFKKQKGGKKDSVAQVLIMGSNGKADRELKAYKSKLQESREHGAAEISLNGE
ncbi:hypothetical protein B0O99DRAFT_602482 [Bisporella sp. PMI_857]|nr:hypothetical protein B0O99DRAFT_602482 [Bisporella sp. PMI_857]